MIVRGTDLIMIRGDSEDLTISCEDYLFQTGDIIEMTVRASLSSPKLLYKKVTTFLEDGSAVISISPSDTQAWTPATYKYDISLTQNDGTIRTIIPMSNFTIKGDITYGN